MIKRNFNVFLLAAVLGGVLMSSQPASAQMTLPGGGTFDLFGPPGLVPESKVFLKAKDGPFNTIYGNFALPGGGELDWHVNPGVAIITMTKGMLNEHHPNGCVSLHEAGDVFFESEGQVHKIFNPSPTESAEALIAFIVPVGVDLVTFVPPPAETPCDPGGDSDGGNAQPSTDLAEIKAALDANTNAIAEIQSLLTRMARTLSLNP
jgi:quercetin dioxygenase-like cupin family protein